MHNLNQRLTPLYADCRDAMLSLLAFLSRGIWVSLYILALSACQPQNTHSGTQASGITVTDFSGNVLHFDQPVRSIIALSPHIVENIYAVGAENTLVGVVEYSDFPAAAAQLPVVASFATTNIERIIELNPDLIMAWESGNSHSALNRLKELGYKVYMDRPDALHDIPKSLRDIGSLTGMSGRAERVAQAFAASLQALSEQHQQKTSVTTFYQVWNTPLQTISGQHIISAAIELCGGQNVYADEFAIAPIINIESVLERNPQAIIASGDGDARPAWLDDWKQWPSLRAVQEQNLFYVNPDHIQRHTTRVLLGIRTICDQLESVRVSTTRSPSPHPDERNHATETDN